MSKLRALSIVGLVLAGLATFVVCAGLSLSVPVETDDEAGLVDLLLQSQ